MRLIDFAAFSGAGGFRDFSFNVAYSWAVHVYRAVEAATLCAITDPTLHYIFGFQRILDHKGREHIVSAPFAGVPDVFHLIDTGIIYVDLF